MLDDKVQQQKFYLDLTVDKEESEYQKNCFLKFYDFLEGAENSEQSKIQEKSQPKNDKKGFNPTYYKQAKLTAGVIDLEPNLEAYNKKVFPFVLDNGSEYLRTWMIQQCYGFFTKFSIPQSMRKRHWLIRVGNRLKFTKDTIEALKQRLEKEGIDPKVDSIITKDLNRTFPDCKTYKQGREMYESMQRILRLFQLYRPDIGYVQGMSYIVSHLYYLFDENKCFALFSNLVICNKFVYSMYSFDVEKVRLEIDVGFIF